MVSSKQSSIMAPVRHGLSFVSKSIMTDGLIDNACRARRCFSVIFLPNMIRVISSYAYMPSDTTILLARRRKHRGISSPDAFGLFILVFINRGILSSAISSVYCQSAHRYEVACRAAFDYNCKISMAELKRLLIIEILPLSFY